jgi:hypothetical protein
MARVPILLALVFAMSACSSESSTSAPAPCLECDAGAADARLDASTDAAASDDGGLSFDVGAGDGPIDDTPACVPTESVETQCNAKDDDCDGLVDNVDVGRDGICDCLGLLILGATGPRPAVTFDAWLKGRGTTVKRRVETGLPELSSADLVGVDVVVLDQLLRDPSAAEIALLVKWVKDGGALVSMTGYTNAGPDTSRPNAILEGLGAKYQAGALFTATITDWSSTHPIAAGVTSATYAGGYPVLTVADAGATSAVVARGPAPASSTVGLALEVGKGRAFVWGDEWIEYDDIWAAEPSVPKLWANVFNWIAAKKCVGRGAIK